MRTRVSICHSEARRGAGGGGGGGEVGRRKGEGRALAS